MGRILITGAGGFIGSHLARACLDRGDDVTALARPGSDLARIADITGKIDVRRAEFGEGTGLQAVIAATRPEVIFHCAMRTRIPERPDLGDMIAAMQENVLPLINLLSAAAGADHPPGVVVRTGTIAEFDPTQDAPADSAYGCSALAATKVAAGLVRRLPFPAVTARLALTYGPGQSDSFLIPSTIRKLLAGDRIDLRRPRDRRDLIHVSDAVGGLLAIARRPDAAGPVVDIASGHAPEMSEVVRTIAELTGTGPDRIRHHTPRGRPHVLCAEPDGMRDRLGWTARFPLRQGLERTVEWERRAARCSPGPQSEGMPA